MWPARVVGPDFQPCRPLAEPARHCALALITVMIPEGGGTSAGQRVVGSQWFAFLVASILSGLVIGFLASTDVCRRSWYARGGPASVDARIPNQTVAQAEAQTQSIDIRGSIRAIGLCSRADLLQTFNNFLGGVFMALMDRTVWSLFLCRCGKRWGLFEPGLYLGRSIRRRVAG